ncbi:MAG: class I SAM-dependent methyltransferase [bacterium]
MEYIDKINQYFRPLVQKYGNNVKSVDWGNREKQYLRFKILCEIANLNGSSVLDVGCGLADLYFYFKQSAFDVKYYGIDIVPEMIEQAKKNYPDANLALRNIINEPFSDEFDYAIASGIIFLGNLELADKIFKSIYHSVRKGFAINSLSAYVGNVDISSSLEFFPRPQELLDIAFGLSNKIVMRHEYLPYDFTIYLYK